MTSMAKYNNNLTYMEIKHYASIGYLEVPPDKIYDLILRAEGVGYTEGQDSCDYVTVGGPLHD